MLMRVVLIYIIISAGLHAELKVGDNAPTFFVRDLNEESFFLSDTLKVQKPTVLDFFATWCVPCIKEMPILDTLSREYKDINFYFVNVSGLMQEKEKKIEDPIKVREMVTKLNISSTILMDKYGKVAEKYGVKSLPRLVVIDGESKIHYIHDGYVPGDQIKLMEVLDKLTVAKK